MRRAKKDESNTSTFIKEFALKNYKTYVAHYESRKLEPISFNDFLKNYSS